MSKSSRVPRVLKAEMPESSRVRRVLKAEMTESSRVPRVLKAEMTGTRRYWYSDDLSRSAYTSILVTGTSVLVHLFYKTSTPVPGIHKPYSLEHTPGVLNIRRSNSLRPIFSHLYRPNLTRY